MRSVREQVEYLREFVTDYKNDLFDRLVGERTNYVRMVVEDLYQEHNCSAVLRSCDCFGVQHVHVVEGENYFHDNADISMGASEWLTVHRHGEEEGGVRVVIDHLRAQGYRIIATTPRERDVYVDELDLHAGKMAFFMGTELTGLSDEVLARADEFVKVPMYGFTESYNVSVCAALLMYSVTRRLRETGIAWQLPEEERDEVLLAWYKRSVKASREILERFDRERKI